MQRKDRPVPEVRRLEDWERMPEDVVSSAKLQKPLDKSHHEGSLAPSVSVPRQCGETCPAHCVRCQWHDKEVNVLHICLGN